MNPYHYQTDILRAIRDGKNVCTVIHRRAGKDLTCVQAWLMRALMRVGTHIYLFPLTKQAREVIWNGIDHQGTSFISYIPKILIASRSEATMTIKLINGSRMVLAGSNNFNSHMGSNPVTIINSEFSLHNPLARQYMNPILVQNGGIEILQYTPRGMNHGYEVLEQVRDNPKYLVQVLGRKQTFKHDGTHVITDEMIEHAKAMGMSEETIRQEFDCLKPDTLIQTPFGSKKIADIRLNDIVISHSGRSRKVEKLYCREYSGKMVRIRTYGNYRNLELTPNHQVRVYNPETQKYTWIRADEVSENHFLCMPKISQGPSLVEDDLIELIAAYLCDGSFSKNATYISIGKHRADRVDRLFRAAKNMGLNVSVLELESSINLVISNTSFCDFLVSNCGSLAKDKRVPLHLISGKEKYFYDCMMSGDGHKGIETGVDNFSTCNIGMAYSMQIVASTLGYKSGISIVRKSGFYSIEGRTGPQSEQYQLQVRTSKPHPKMKNCQKIRTAKYAVAVKVIKVTQFNYNGPVHNIAVQYDNSYVAEGRVVHNCDFFVGNVGSYFTREVTKMHDENRIMSDLKPRPDLPLHTAWDLGRSDATAIWFFQIVGNYVHLVHYFQESDRPMSYFVEYAEKYRQNYGCRFGMFFGPHDIKQETQGWEYTESRLKQARAAGYHFQVTPKVNFGDGIEQMRFVMDRMRIDKKECALGLRAIREYSRKYDEVLQKYSHLPVDAWYTHAMDALRYLCVNYRRLFEIPEQSKIIAHTRELNNYMHGMY